MNGLWAETLLRRKIGLIFGAEWCLAAVNKWGLVMKLGKFLIVGVAVASLSGPAIAAVRPSVKAVDVSVQKSVIKGVHKAGRSGARLSKKNEFIPGLGVGLIGAFASTATIVGTTFVVNRWVFEIPLLGELYEVVGIGRAITVGPYGTASIS